MINTKTNFTKALQKRNDWRIVYQIKKKKIDTNIINLQHEKKNSVWTIKIIKHLNTVFLLKTLKFSENMLTNIKLI